MRFDDDYRALAARQLGLLTIQQLRVLGVRPSAIRHRVARGELERIGLRVLRVAGSASTEHQAALAAVFDAGPDAALSHESAAALWGLPGFRLRPFHVSMPRGSDESPSRVGLVHRLRTFDQRLRTVFEGIPVVRPELLVLQLCGVLHPGRAERALDTLWHERLLSGPSTRATLDRVAASGVRGVVLLRRLLDERGPHYVPPASGLEARFVQVLRNAGLDPMEPQRDLGDGEQWCGRVDFADPPGRRGRALIEVNSMRFHKALLDEQSDALRSERLRRGGFVVGTVWDTQVFHRPDEVLEEVRHVRWLAHTGVSA